MTTTLIEGQTELIHVQYSGLSFDLLQADLGIGPQSADARVKRAVAHVLNVPADRLRSCVIARHPDGNLTIEQEPEVQNGAD